jgi:hypothetical protein
VRTWTTMPSSSVHFVRVADNPFPIQPFTLNASRYAAKQRKETLQMGCLERTIGSNVPAIFSAISETRPANSTPL